VRAQVGRREDNSHKTTVCEVWKREQKTVRRSVCVKERKGERAGKRHCVRTRAWACVWARAKETERARVR